MRTLEQIRADAAAESAFSNHSEYEIWADRNCYECVHDNPETDTFCPILSVALLGGWPKEWTRRRVEFTTVEGKLSFYEVVDTCTEFEQRPDDEGGGDDDPPPDGPGPFDAEQPGQTDIFTFFAEDAISKLQPVGAEALAPA